MELSSQGFSQTDICTVLHVDKSIISKDIALLNQQARENLQHHIHETIPAEYQKSRNTLNQVLRMTWAIVGKTEDEKTRLQALALVHELNKYRTELVTNGAIVHDSLQVIQSKVEQLNGNGKGKAQTDGQDLVPRSDDKVNEEIGEEQLPTTNGVF